MHTRFMHTSDWQLGVTRQFLNPDSQALWTAARFEGIRNLGRIAEQAGCEFIVVAGDVFETNQVDRRIVLKACEVLAGIAMPVYLLPANHDPLDAASVFRSKTWFERKPPQVQVLDTPGRIVTVRPGIEVVGAPWMSKRPLTDLVAASAAHVTASSNGLRIMVGHGAVDTLSPDRNNPALIQIADAEQAIEQGQYQYLALGDRHSFTAVGSSGRIFYSGTHETYDFDEIDPGKVLIVDLERDSVKVTPQQNGCWRFLVHQARISTLEDVQALARQLEAIPDKERCVLKLGLVGTLSIQLQARLEEIEERAHDLFAAVVRSTSRSDLVVIPDDADFEGLALAGFAAVALAKLRVQAQGQGSAQVPGQGQDDEREQAADALGLLVRLVGKAA
jgi:DNA repair exonuclease SbcCD nuclease subunit